MKFFLLLLLWLPMAVLAQDKTTEQLLLALPQAAEDSTRVRMHNQLSHLYFATDIQEGNRHAAAALAIADSSGNKPGKSKALLLLARGHLMLGEFDRGLGKSYTALKIGEQLQDSTLIMAAHNMLGIMYSKLHDDTYAVHHYTVASELAVKLNLRGMLAKVYNNLGGIHDEAGNYDKALSLYRKAADLQESMADVYSLSVSLYNIGSLHLHLQKPLDGLPYLHRSINLNKSIGNIMLLSTAYESISKIYRATGDKAKALHFANQSYKAALVTESSKKISAAAQLVQQIHASRGEYKEAYTYMAIVGEHEAKLDRERQQKAAHEITARIDAEAKELELLKLAAEKEKQAIQIKYQQTVLLLGGVVFLALLISSIILLYSRSRINRTNRRLLDANQQLQAQHLKISSQWDEISAQALLLQQQNAALEKHSTFKSKIFSVISHDLRAPFNSLRGVLKMAQKQSMAKTQMNHVFSLLEKEVETTGAMLHNILEWAKSQLDTSHVTREPLNLHQVATEGVRQADAQAKAKQITVINEVSPIMTALADRERLSFIIRNLLSNAMKFTYAGGEIGLVSHDMGHTVSIAVRDNGKGISAQGLEQLFTEKRYTTLGTQQEKGTGLGLALIREFVISMGGSIAVESTLGKGTIFTVSLPKPEQAIGHVPEFNAPVDLEPSLNQL